MTTQELTPKEKQELQEKEQTRPGGPSCPTSTSARTSTRCGCGRTCRASTQDQVEVELHDDVLRLEGRVSPQEYEGLTPVYTEYNVGNYLRRFTLTNAQHFDREQISARLVNGVLEVKLPKAEQAKPRRIPVSA